MAHSSVPPPFAASLAHGGVSTVDIACGDGFGVASRQAPPFMATPIMVGFPRWTSPAAMTSASRRGRPHHSRQTPPFAADPTIHGFANHGGVSTVVIAFGDLRRNPTIRGFARSWWGFHRGYRLRRFTQKPHHSRLRSLMVGFPQWLSPSAIYLRLPFYRVYFTSSLWQRGRCRR